MFECCHRIQQGSFALTFNCFDYYSTLFLATVFVVVVAIAKSNSAFDFDNCYHAYALIKSIANTAADIVTKIKTLKAC